MKIVRAVAGSGERGFMLVGVVIFVLALSILGLSLFSLSSFEAQFMGGTSDEQQAFYSALGGLERAKYVLAAKSQLPAVKLNLPLENVIYARARWAGTSDSVSAIVANDWKTHRKIEVRVMAEYRGARRMIEADYYPDRSHDIYTGIITSRNGIWVDNLPGESPWITGDVWQNTADLSWQAVSGDEYPGVFSVSTSGAPVPQSSSYVDDWSASASTIPGNPNPGSDHFRLHANNPYEHFLAPSFPGNPEGSGSFGYVHDEELELRVRGTAILMFDNGAYFKKHVRVTGNTDDALIIVAKESDNLYFPNSPRSWPNAGLWFKGGLSSPTVPVILVSSGTVAIDFNVGEEVREWFYYLTIFAGGVYARRPLGTPGEDLRLCHHPGQGMWSPPDLDERVLNPLYENGLLPNVSGPRTGTFQVSAGTWREVTEDDPD